jgi:hypothetical protein
MRSPEQQVRVVASDVPIVPVFSQRLVLEACRCLARPTDLEEAPQPSEAGHGSGD